MWQGKMKLIDVDNFINNLRLLLNRTTLGEISPHESISVGEIATLIKNEPIAYDLDKVMEQLERDSQDIALINPTDQGYDYENAIGIDINKAKEIVKFGGIE